MRALACMRTHTSTHVHGVLLVDAYAGLAICEYCGVERAWRWVMLLLGFRHVLSVLLSLSAVAQVAQTS